MLLSYVIPELLHTTTSKCARFYLSCGTTAFLTPRHQKKVICQSQRTLQTSKGILKRQQTNDASYAFTPVNYVAAKRIFRQFENDKAIQNEAQSEGLANNLFQKSLRKFRHSAISSKPSLLSMQVHYVLQGIESKRYGLRALLPLFLDHSHKLFPSVKRNFKLKKISDLSEPTLWYPVARTIKREVIFHAGPTNSGKTHAALESFLEANSAVYCSPLRLLAREVCQKSRKKGVACDMITGDDRDFAHGTRKRTNKVACTVEMTNLNKVYDVAVIDEIQMITDIQRGWAWTRAFLGVCAKEIHVCGEERAVAIIRKLTRECGDSFSVVNYKRMGVLRVKKNPVNSLDNLEPGDCIVCFNKEQIYNYKKQLENRKIEAAIIYGNLPPRTKLEESRKFNDPAHPCNVLVATDAIGMGLNLNIKRIIFNDVSKMSTAANGERQKVKLSSSQALQIAGRAGRFGSHYPDGAVTAMKSHHQSILHKLLKTKDSNIKAAGLHPSFNKIEEFASFMKTSSLAAILNHFISLCETDDSLYFLCSLKECQEIAQTLDHIKLPLKDMYTFCQSPVSPKREYVMVALIVLATFHANNEKMLHVDMRSLLKWPPKPASNKEEMVLLEDMHECLRLYLWLSYRFPETFVDSREVKEMMKTIDRVTQQSVSSRLTSDHKVRVESDKSLWKELNDFLVDA